MRLLLWQREDKKSRCRYTCQPSIIRFDLLKPQINQDSSSTNNTFSYVSHSLLRYFDPNA